MPHGREQARIGGDQQIPLTWTYVRSAGLQLERRANGQSSNGGQSIFRRDWGRQGDEKRRPKGSGKGEKEKPRKAGIGAHDDGRVHLNQPRFKGVGEVITRGIDEGRGRIRVPPYRRTRTNAGGSKRMVDHPFREGGGPNR